MKGKIDFTGTDDALYAWMLRTGQVVAVNGKLKLWRRYHDSMIYTKRFKLRIYRVAKDRGLDVVE